MIKAIGFSVIYREGGYEPCIIYSDYTVKHVYPLPHPLSAVDACNEAKSLAAQSELPYISRIESSDALNNLEVIENA